jgi:hypothetical protein
VASKPASCAWLRRARDEFGLTAAALGGAPYAPVMTRRGRRLLTTLALASLVTAAISGCSDDDDDDGGGGTTVEALVGRVPAGASFGDAVVYGSPKRIRAAGDVDAAASVDDELRQLLELAGPSLFVAEPFGEQLRVPELRDEVGFDITLIDATIQAGEPPEWVSVFAGGFDTAEVDRALTTYEPWASFVEVDEEDGIATYRFGEEGDRDFERRTAARQFGESVRVAVADGTVAWTRSDATFDATISAAADGPSLLDVDGVRDVARALDEATAHLAVITTDPTWLGFDPIVLLGGDFSVEAAAELEERLADAPVLNPWRVGGFAEVLGDDGPELLVVAWYPDAEAGDTAAERLTTVLVEGTSLVDGEPWADLCPDPQVDAADGLVTARCALEGPGAALALFYGRDTPLLWQR